jgi:hypothetical protein
LFNRIFVLLNVAVTEETVQFTTQQTTTTPKWRSAWEEQQHNRRMHIRNHCPKSGSTLDEVLNQPHFSDYDFMDLAIVDEAHKLIYCGVPKVIHSFGFEFWKMKTQFQSEYSCLGLSLKSKS